MLNILSLAAIICLNCFISCFYTSLLHNFRENFNQIYPMVLGSDFKASKAIIVTIIIATIIIVAIEVFITEFATIRAYSASKCSKSANVYFLAKDWSNFVIGVYCNFKYLVLILLWQLKLF